MRFVVAVAVFQNNVCFRIQNQNGIKVTKRILTTKGSRARLVFVARGHDKRRSTRALLPSMAKPPDLGVESWQVRVGASQKNMQMAAAVVTPPTLVRVVRLDCQQGGERTKVWHPRISGLCPKNGQRLDSANEK